MIDNMTRREARELAFILLFEKSFTDCSIKDILSNAGEARDIKVNAFALELAEGVDKHIDEIDPAISANSHKWNKERISRVGLAIMRLAVFEMRYMNDIPVSVSINEAVELAKKYGGDEDPAFINGVLGGVALQKGE
ncbi:MAG: transcription antitermination factor NusB [Oscillospiraceae bacterium]|nr:transcription antitermination factor NusB [Oscillospiraceae bacterium]MDD4546813.1 transcription antitermination factor NusB [Oscillospiraceae bacterium]